MKNKKPKLGILENFLTSNTLLKQLRKKRKFVGVYVRHTWKKE